MNISRDTFDKLKHYVGVRLQQGVPLVDADWNEQEDIRRYELQAFLKWFVGNGVPEGNDGFRILPVTDEIGNDFIIKGGDDTAEGAGRCLVEGWDVINESNLNYTAQLLYEEEDLATKWGVAPVKKLKPPTDGGRTDTVYLDVWEREVDFKEDKSLINSAIGVGTCVRLKREWVVRVAEGKSENELPAPPAGHVYCPLAMLTRVSEKDRIEADDITDDLRSTDVHLASAPSTTGVVVFPEFTHSKRNISDSINPGLGPGAISVRLGLDCGDDGIFVGDSQASYIFESDIFKLDSVLIGALIDPQSGTFMVGIEVPELKTTLTRVRWWAFKPRQDIGEVIVIPGIHVAITPVTVTLNQGATKQFNATVTGTTNKAVKWEADEGSVSDEGLYTAPNKVGTFHVRAISGEDTSKYAEATITVRGVSVTVDPKTVTLNQGATQQFTAKVTGTTNEAVTWIVMERGGGSVNDKGLYTAPNKAGTFHVRATSKADASKSAEATITVKAAVSVTVDPKTVTLKQGATQQFTAKVTGTTNEAVTWIVMERGGGSVNDKGLYTAPNKAGTFHVRATSKADASKSAEATITVQPEPCPGPGMPDNLLPCPGPGEPDKPCPGTHPA